MATSNPFLVAVNKFVDMDFQKATEDEIQVVCDDLYIAIYKDVDRRIIRTVMEDFLIGFIRLLDTVIEKDSITLFFHANIPLEKFLTCTKRNTSFSLWYVEIASRMLTFLENRQENVTRYLSILKMVLSRLHVGYPIDPFCTTGFVLALTRSPDADGAEVARSVITHLLMHMIPEFQSLTMCLPWLVDNIRGRTEVSPELCATLGAIGYQLLEGYEETAEALTELGLVEELVRLVQHASSADPLPAYIGTVLITLCKLARQGPGIIDRITACKAMDSLKVFIHHSKPTIKKNASMLASYILNHSGLFNPLVRVHKTSVPYPSAMLRTCSIDECEAVVMLLEVFMNIEAWEPWFIEERVYPDLDRLKRTCLESTFSAYWECLEAALLRVKNRCRRYKIEKKLGILDD